MGAVWCSAPSVAENICHLRSCAQRAVRMWPRSETSLRVECVVEKNGMWLMGQYVFHPALLPHMSSQEQAELSVWWGGEAEEEGRGKHKGREKEVFMSESAMNLTCFPDLIYVNSTCSLRDKAFNTSDRNFMPYLLWKYFDVEIKPQSGCWITFQLCAGGDFAKLTCRLSNCHPFMAGNYFLLQRKHFLFKVGNQLFFFFFFCPPSPSSSVIGGGGKTSRHSHARSTGSHPTWLSSLSRCIKM